MKISKKRFEEILLEEVKVFVQEKKLEEDGETNEDCGDMPAPKKTIKIKIKQQSIFCLDGALKTSYIPNGNEI